MRKFNSLDEIPKGLEPVKDMIAFLLDPMLYPSECVKTDIEYIELHFDMLWRLHTTIFMKYRESMGLHPEDIEKSPYKIIWVGAEGRGGFRVSAELPEEVSSNREGYFYFILK